MKKLTLLTLLACFCATAQAQTNPEDTKKNAERNFETKFMPGGGYGYLMPKGKDSLGTLSGAVVEFLFYSQVAQNNDFGPSHTRFYGKLNILKSDKKNITDFFMYSVGLNLSIERNPQRTFLIPYFGLEMGGISNKSLNTTLQFTPMLGLHVVARKNIFVNLHAGYMYPVKNFDIMRGTSLQGTINFSLW